MTCANVRCKHHSSKTGCTLFPGKSWLQCRRAKPQPANKPEKGKNQ